MSTSTSTDVLVIAASNGYNLQLAERFAAAARQQGHSAAVIDLTTIDLPLFTRERKSQANRKCWRRWRPSWLPPRAG
jgi:chromate reductase, NAD(P)H dehydrogenase (quinone)